MVCEVVLWCSVCSEVVLWCSACARKQGPWEPLPPFYCHKGAIAPPLPLSPLFCMMYKSINGGGSGGGGSGIRHPKISESGPQPIDTLIYLYPPPLNTFLHT